MPRKPKSPLSLSQDASYWYVGMRRLRTWIKEEEDEDEYFRPWILIFVHQNAGMILFTELMKTEPTPQEIQKNLVKAMLKPQESSLSPHRPAEIHFEERYLVNSLTGPLQEFGVAARYQPQTKRLDSIIDDLNSYMAVDAEGLPGLLQQRDVSRRMVERLYDAARFFWQAEPWIYLLNEDLLAIQVGNQPHPNFVSVMGNAGQEYGLSLFDTWQDVEDFFTASDPEETLPTSGRHVFFFDKPPMVSFDDMDAIERYGWELPAPDIYPTPLVFTPEEVLRPKAHMLRWYEAVLRSIPLFVDQYMKTGREVDSDSIQAHFSVQTSAGKTQVHIRYPGGDLEQVRNWSSQAKFQMLKTDEEDIGFPLPDRRGMESNLAQIGASLGGVEIYHDPTIYKAQEIMYDAWDEPNPAKRLKLAKKALTISPDCADAYVLLAEHTTNRERALELYQNGVDAGQRALGEEFLQDPENIGNFWSILETRPYMRSLEGLATTLWDLDRREEALAKYREILHLNPGDNQGIRYLMLDLLLELGNWEELEHLLQSYAGDWSADWAYTETLAAFHKFGDSRQAKKALKHALQVNRHVVNYLTGKKRISAQESPYITMGGEDEASAYASNHLNHWRKTPGAIAWLEKSVK